MVLLVNIYLFIIIYRCILIHSPICMSILLFSPKLPDMDQWPTSILRTNDGMAIFIGWEDEDILITWNSSQAARAWLNHATSSRQTSCRGFRHVERKNDICKQKTRKLKPGSQKKAFDVKFQDLRLWLWNWNLEVASAAKKTKSSSVPRQILVAFRIFF